MVFYGVVLDEIGWLMKRSSSMFGERWQRRIFYIKGNSCEGHVLHYTDLTEDHAASVSQSLFRKPSGDKTMAFGKNTTVLLISCNVLQCCVKTYALVNRSQSILPTTPNLPSLARCTTRSANSFSKPPTQV
jgi:hypothetical protein